MLLLPSLLDLIYHKSPSRRTDLSVVIHALERGGREEGEKGREGMGFTACNLGAEIWQEEQEQERNLTGCSGMHKVIGAWLIVGVTRVVRCNHAA